MKKEQKTFDSNGREVKFFQIDGSKVQFKSHVTENDNGILIAKFSGILNELNVVDRGRDIVASGAAIKTIADLQQKNRFLRLFYQHSRHTLPLGGFPAMGLSESSTAIEFKDAELNLGMEQFPNAMAHAQSVYALLLGKHLSDMSIGFTIVDSEMIEREGQKVRLIKELVLWEGSVVDEPMNMGSVITEVSSNDDEDITADDIEGIKTKRDLEKFLRDVGLNQITAKKISSRFQGEKRDVGPQGIEEKRDVDLQKESFSVPKNTLNEMKRFIAQI